MEMTVVVEKRIARKTSIFLINVFIMRSISYIEIILAYFAKKSRSV